MTTALGTTITAPRELVSAPMFARLTRRVMTDHGIDQTAAEQITDQALAFLQTCALTPQRAWPRPPRSTRAGTRSSCTPPTTPSSASASPAASSTTCLPGPATRTTAAPRSTRP
jgi:hypothetical protein